MWGVWIAAARPRTLPAAVAPVVVGSALAWRDNAFDGAAALICLGFALLVQIGTNFANDYFDFVHGADTAARQGPRRAVAAGLVSPATMRNATVVVFAVAFLLGLSLIAWGGPWLLVVGVTSIISGVAYTGGPWPLAYHGWGDVFVFIFFGLVAVAATYFVQAGRVSTDALLAAVPVGLLAANILVVNNYRDADTDAVAGKRTLVVILGRRAARAQFGLSLVGAFAVPVLLAWRHHHWAYLVPLLLVPVAWRHARRLRDSKTPSELIALLGATGRLLALYALGFALGLLLSSVQVSLQLGL
ncbi:1,4-dihydroxy-2-naphthoate polyprenyltransferase [Opitutus sp. ER46]|uniref:1,4-dihydroxy-2-naphthoate polyprenyltransferase n=1 Tax=Opitutus sp. ER46 TaxID=2161864 RepID=UPI000D304A44|nr:1,4-dihydroxy-2-naphthoate octaprenyltransferase [Opitutus sp. ER46]